MARRRDKMPVAKAIIKRYHKQRDRGHDGFGFITIDKGKISGIHRFEKEAEAMVALADVRSSEILFHHRFPTSTPNYKDMTHPIVVKNDLLDKDYYVVHNGVLQNEYELKAKHEKMGFKYTTQLKETFIVETISGRTEKISEQFNDSESLSIEVALYLDGKQKDIEAIGSISFVCFETDKDGLLLNIHYGRNAGNPLVIEDNNDLFFIKSMGDGDKIEENQIDTINYLTGEKSSRLLNVGELSRTAGFHSDVNTTFPLLSPNEYLPEGRRINQNRLPSVYDDDDWSYDPNGILLSSEADPYNDNTEWGQVFEAYKLTDEYLLELWNEIESLKSDMKECQDKLTSGMAGDPLTEEDIIYNEEYLSECADILAGKQEEADILERYLKVKDGKGKLIK